MHKVRSFAYGRQPLPLRPYMSERLARSQRQGWKLTSEREIRREEGTDGGGEGELSANKGEEKTADGGEEGGDKWGQTTIHAMGWGVSKVDMHIHTKNTTRCTHAHKASHWHKYLHRFCNQVS